MFMKLAHNMKKHASLRGVEGKQINILTPTFSTLSPPAWSRQHIEF